jgi:oligoendopeptidase F
MLPAMKDSSKPLSPRAFPRTFVPADLGLGTWAAVEPLFRNLLDRPVPSAAALGKWLSDLGELSDVLDEEGAIRYIRMTRHTDDPIAEKEYLRFLSEVGEPSKPLLFGLMKRYLDCPHRDALPRADMEVFDRSTRNQVALFREENVPLETQLETLAQRYQKLSGALTVFFDGREQTIQQMGRYLESPDRALRESSWHAVQTRRLAEKDALDSLYDEMRILRSRVATNAGFSDYRDFVFSRLERFDYKPQDCFDFHEGVERFVVPLVARIQSRRAHAMGLDRLRPWDTQNDLKGRPPLKPFSDVGDLTEKTLGILKRVDPVFGTWFASMRDEGLLDLESRKGKAPGGYNAPLAESRVPFIFMNAVGLDSDVRTLLHEAGHAMHTFASQPIPFAFYRHAPIEFCEVASMGMELICEPYLSEFYPDPAEANRSSLKHFEDILTLLPWIAQVDAFQHWVYTHPDHSPCDRRAAWLGLCERFAGGVDWQGLEEQRAYLWHKQLHLFEHPFYYIEYGIAQLGALQVWRNVKKDPKGGLDLYKRGLSVGGSLPLPGIFEAAGIRFDFSRAMLEPLMAEVEAEIERLEKTSDMKSL